MAKKIKKNKTEIKAGFISRYKIQLLVIGLLVFVLYAHTIKFNFVTLDDTTLITDNYSFIHNLGNIKAAFLHDVFYNPATPNGANLYYRPLLTLSLMADSQFSGQSPQFYHFINILLHLVTCLLLFRFLLLLRFSSETAFCGALLFAVHPVLSQAIGWIPGRNDSMLTMFTLASLIYFIRFLETNKKPKLWFHIFFFALAVYTKETACLLPFIILLYYILIYKPQQQQAKHGFGRGNWMALLAGYVLVLLPWFLLRQNVVSHSTADMSFQHLSTTFIGNLPVLIQVVQKIMVPYNLSTMSVVADTNYILGVLAIALLIVLIVLSKQKRWQYILFGFIWFNIFLLPSLMVPVLTGFEHRAYLPLVGFLLIVFEIDYFKKLNYANFKSYAFIAAVIVVFIVINFNHTSVFADSFSFWKNAAVNSPHSSLAKLNYGKVLEDEGETDDAVAVYKEGITINPSEPMIHNNLGIIYAKRSMYADAEKEFKEENKINPNYSDAYYNLSIVYKKTGRDSAMVAALQQALTLNPNHELARKSLDRYYQMKMLLQK